MRFASLAEAFAASPLPTRDALMHILGAFVRGSHKTTMQALKQALAAETWAAASAGAAGSVEVPDAVCLQQSLNAKACAYAAFDQPGFVSDFTECVKAGNPFCKQGRVAGGACGFVTLTVLAWCGSICSCLVVHICICLADLDMFLKFHGPTPMRAHSVSHKHVKLVTQLYQCCVYLQAGAF